MNQQVKREEGLQLLAEGMAPAEVAPRVGVDEMTAYRWRDRGNSEQLTSYLQATVAVGNSIRGR